MAGIMTGAALLTGCSTSRKQAAEKSTLARIDMTKWLYNSEDNVYYQTGISYAANPADSEYESLGLYVPGAYFTGKDNGDGTYTVSVNKNGTQNIYFKGTSSNDGLSLFQNPDEIYINNEQQNETQLDNSNYQNQSMAGENERSGLID